MLHRGEWSTASFGRGVQREKEGGQHKALACTERLLSWWFAFCRRIITSGWRDEAVSKRRAFLLYSWLPEGKTTCSRSLSWPVVELTFEAMSVQRAGI